MAPTIEVSCRVDYRANSTDRFSEHTSRLDSLSATGCTIRSRALPDTDMLELRIYLPDGEWPLRIDRAKVTWIHWDGFTAEFLEMPAADQRRLGEYLWAESLLQAA